MLIRSAEFDVSKKSDGAVPVHRQSTFVVVGNNREVGEFHDKTNGLGREHSHVIGPHRYTSHAKSVNEGQMTAIGFVAHGINNQHKSLKIESHVGVGQPRK